MRPLVLRIAALYGKDSNTAEMAASYLDLVSADPLTGSLLYLLWHVLSVILKVDRPADVPR